MSPVRQIQLLQSARTSSILRTQKIGVDAKMSSSSSLISSVYPLATILARTVLPFFRRTHLDLMIFLRCSGLSWLMCTSVYTPCSFIDLISCFIPSVVCSLSRPPVLFTQGSRRNLLCFDLLFIFVGRCFYLLSFLCCDCHC